MKRKNLSKIPIIYPIWHSFRLLVNRYMEHRKVRCYKKNAMRVLKEVSDIAIDNDYSLMCAWGTLLGIIRDNCLLPWDDDVDFVLIEKGEKGIVGLEAILINNGFKLFRVFEEEGIIKEKSYKKRGVLCDIRVWPEHEKDFITEDTYYKINGVKYINGEYCDYEVSYFLMPVVKQIRRYSFKGIDVLIPDNPEEVLAAEYGSSWRIPDPSYDSKREKKRIKQKVTYYGFFSR